MDIITLALARRYVDKALSETDIIKGKDGVSVVGAYLNKKGHLMIQLSDETEIDAGALVGDLGEMPPKEGETESTPYTVKSYVDSKVTDGIANIVADAPEAFDTFKEIADWIAKDTENEQGFDAANRITTLETVVGKSTIKQDQWHDEEIPGTGLIKRIEDLENADVQSTLKYYKEGDPYYPQAKIEAASAKMVVGPDVVNATTVEGEIKLDADGVIIKGSKIDFMDWSENKVLAIKNTKAYYNGKEIATLDDLAIISNDDIDKLFSVSDEEGKGE